jgi:hydrogenase expression/formation protein HypD
VTAEETVEQTLAIAAQPGVIFCSFGDMLRVPSGRRDLLTLKASGADIRTVYSPIDAVHIAQRNPHRDVVFFAVGFETTAPATALAVLQARQLGLRNFSLLVSHVLVPPAMTAILSAEQCRIQGFLAAGHVCTVMGTGEYEPLVERYRVPIVITGFEPVDLLDGIYRCVRQLEAGVAAIDNSYTRCVRSGGNPAARAWLEEVFTIVDRNWRGIGVIANSGWGLRESFSDLDAGIRWQHVLDCASEVPCSAGTKREGQFGGECLSGLILQGLKKPLECPEFGRRCTPDEPLGATMVSAEGACAAYYRYRRGASAVL